MRRSTPVPWCLNGCDDGESSCRRAKSIWKTSSPKRWVCSLRRCGDRPACGHARVVGRRRHGYAPRLRWTGLHRAREIAGGPLRQFLVHDRWEEHTSELTSRMRTSYAVFCLKIHKEHQTNRIQENLIYTHHIISI